MPEDYLHERQRIASDSGKLGALSHVETVKIRVHVCVPPFCYQCADGGRPVIRARPMTEAELEERERIGSPVLPDWSLD